MIAGQRSNPQGFDLCMFPNVSSRLGRRRWPRTYPVHPLWLQASKLWVPRARPPPKFLSANEGWFSI
jgi:hypothetical protein